MYKHTHTHIYVCACALSCSQLFVSLCTVACLASLSMGFSRQECWRGFPCPLPGDLPKPRIEPAPPLSPKWASMFFYRYCHLGSLYKRMLLLLLSRVSHVLQPFRLLRPWDFPGNSTGLGCHCLLKYKSIHGCYFNNNKIYNKMLNLISAVVF